MAPLAYFVHDIDPYVFHIAGKFGLRWYGMSYLMGFVSAWMLFHYYAKTGRSRLTRDRIDEFMFFAIAGVMLGGRLGYFLLYRPGLFVTDPLSVLKIWDGGMASHGGFIGVTAAVILYSRISKIPLVHLGDLAASVAPAGLFFGRIANFINGELVGRVTNVSWAFIFPGDKDPRHPSQLYEAGLEGLLLFVLVQWRFWRTDVVKTQPGRLCGEFLIGYAIVRAIGETFRDPDASLILGLTRGTFYSLFLVVGGVILIFKASGKGKAEST